MITGSLQKDSPSLYSKLKRLFTISEICEFEITYLEISQLPQILSENEWREKGVNFNPQPARILEILIECGCNSKDTLLHALKNTTDSEPRLVTYPESSLALILDDVRHLGYNKNPQPKYQQLKLEFFALMQALPDSNNVNPKLVAKVNTAFRLYQKFA